MDMAANTLQLYEALTEFGRQPGPDSARKVEAAIDERQSRALGNVMTKEDGANLGASLRTEIAAVRTEIATVRTEVAVLTQRVTQIGLSQEAMRAEMHEKFMTKEDGIKLEQRLSEKFDRKFEKFETKIDLKFDKLLYWMIGTVIALVIAVKIPWHF